MGSMRFYAHAQNLWKLHGVLGWLNCMGVLGWFKWVGVLCWLDWACPTSCACLFILRLGVLSNILSHMWGNLNLPILLFNVGLLTLINIDSLMVLAKPCPSLPIIWKLFWLAGWPVLLLWWCTGEGSFRCSLNLSSKVLEVSPMYSTWHVWSPHGTNIWPNFCWPWNPCPLVETRRFLVVLLPLK